MAPVSVDAPSPKSTWTLEMFAPVAGVTVNVIGTPALADEGLAVNEVRPRALTVTVDVPDSEPTEAVIFAVAVVLSVAVATPLLSVVTVDGVIDPLSVEKVTGTPPIGLPPSSTTVATTCVEPPVTPRDCGVVVTETLFA